MDKYKPGLPPDSNPGSDVEKVKTGQGLAPADTGIPGFTTQAFRLDEISPAEFERLTGQNAESDSKPVKISPVSIDRVPEKEAVRILFFGPNAKEVMGEEFTKLFTKISSVLSYYERMVNNNELTLSEVIIYMDAEGVLGEVESLMKETILALRAHHHRYYQLASKQGEEAYAEVINALGDYCQELYFKISINYPLLMKVFESIYDRYLMELVKKTADLIKKEHSGRGMAVSWNRAYDECSRVFAPAAQSAESAPDQDKDRVRSEMACLVVDTVRMCERFFLGITDKKSTGLSDVGAKIKDDIKIISEYTIRPGLYSLDVNMPGICSVSLRIDSQDENHLCWGVLLISYRIDKDDVERTALFNISLVKEDLCLVNGFEEAGKYVKNDKQNNYRLMVVEVLEAVIKILNDGRDKQGKQVELVERIDFGRFYREMEQAIAEKEKQNEEMMMAFEEASGQTEVDGYDTLKISGGYESRTTRSKDTRKGKSKIKSRGKKERLTAVSYDRIRRAFERMGFVISQRGDHPKLESEVDGKKVSAPFFNFHAGKEHLTPYLTLKTLKILGISLDDFVKYL